MKSTFQSKYDLRKFLESEFSDDKEKQKKLSKLIASYVAASVREDRKTRSLFTNIFG